jgi:hypothetical protein
VVATEPPQSRTERLDFGGWEPLEHSYFPRNGIWLPVSLVSTPHNFKSLQAGSLDRVIRFDYGVVDRRPDPSLITGVFQDALKHEEEQIPYPPSISNGGITRVTFYRLQRDKKTICLRRDQSGRPLLNHPSSLRMPLEALKQPDSLRGLWIRSPEGAMPALKVGSFFHDSEMCLTRSQSQGLLKPPLQNDIIEIKYHDRHGWFYRRLEPSNKDEEEEEAKFFMAPDCYYVQNDMGEEGSAAE